MEELEQKIIKRANLLCEHAFMDFPDYDKDNPITTLADALTVFVFDGMQVEDVDSSEIYNLLIQKLK